MLKLSVKHDLDSIARKMDGITRKDIPKAATTALNKTAANVRVATQREITRETSVSKKLVDPYLKVKKANWNKLTAYVVAKARTFNLIRFATAAKIKDYRKSGGLVARAWGGKARPFKGVFVGNKGRTAFVRETAARLSIRPAYGPSIPRAMVSDSIRRNTNKVIKERFPKLFRHELERSIKRREKRR